jgi:hypothetical protein
VVLLAVLVQIKAVFLMAVKVAGLVVLVVVLLQVNLQLLQELLIQ